jgi:hypothetical protein
VESVQNSDLQGASLRKNKDFATLRLFQFRLMAEEGAPPKKAAATIFKKNRL